MSWNKVHDAATNALEKLSEMLTEHTMKRFGVDRSEAIRINAVIAAKSVGAVGNAQNTVTPSAQAIEK